MCRVFFFNDTATTEIYTLSLHDALPISDSKVVALNLVQPEDWLNSMQNFAVQMEMLSFLRPLYPKAHVTLHAGDRKSTRLNSSHANISYAVFCLKKKQCALTADVYGRCT